MRQRGGWVITYIVVHKNEKPVDIEVISTNIERGFRVTLVSRLAPLSLVYILSSIKSWDFFVTP
jgi:hypothetical protein